MIDNYEIYLHHKGFPVPTWRQQYKIKIFFVFARLGCKTVTGNLNPGIIFRLKIKEIKIRYHINFIPDIHFMLSKLRELP